MLVKKSPNTFGSVTFNMAKLAHSKEKSMIQWVTLYDDPSDDVFDGTLGVDDDYPPRLLLEYTILGGKYTSLMSTAQDLLHKVGVSDPQQSSAIPLMKPQIPSR